NLFGSFALVAFLAQLDEVRIFREAAGVEVERDLVPPADIAHRLRIFHRDRLAAARVVRDRQHDQRNALAADPRDQLLERRHIHIALEGVAVSRLIAFGDEQVRRFRTHELDVGASAVEVAVVGHHIALLAHHAEKYPFGRPSLMGRDDVTVAEDILNAAPEAVKSRAARVAFIAFHHGGHWAVDIAPVPESVSRSIRVSLAGPWNRL